MDGLILTRKCENDKWSLEMLLCNGYTRPLLTRCCSLKIAATCFVRARRVYSCHVLWNVGKLNIQLDFSAHSFSDELYTQRRTYVLLLYYKRHSKGLEYSKP